MFRGALIAFLFLVTNPVFAGIVITGTRVIYPAKDKEVTIRMTNEGTEPALMQAWIDRGNPDLRPDQADGPFVLTPPVARVEPGKGQVLRVTFTGELALPQDRESLFWLNVLDIPPAVKNPDANVLQIAVRSRLKIFYRPEHLHGTLSEAAAAIKWSWVGKGSDRALRAANQSPYYISFKEIALDGDNGSNAGRVKNAVILEPFSAHGYPLSEAPEAPPEKPMVHYTWIDEYGAAIEERHPLVPPPN